MTRIGSLCSGYGGLDLALEAFTGGTTAWHVEYDKHPSAILAHRFPGVPNYGDVTTTDWSQVEPTDWLTAGYPCQPFSHAGKRKGSADVRHIWPHVGDAIRALRPRGVLLENVAGHLSLGFGQVLGDLAEIGYDTRWLCLRAADAGAPHGRARVFIVATDTSGERHGRGVHPGNVGRLDSPDAGEARQRERAWQEPVDRSATTVGNAQVRGRDGSADADGCGERSGPIGRSDSDFGWGVYADAVHRWERVTGRRAPVPTESGRLSPRFAEWMMGLPAGWVTDVPGLSRGAQLKALGNGVVPQQALLALRLLVPASAAVAA